MDYRQLKMVKEMQEPLKQEEDAVAQVKERQKNAEFAKHKEEKIDIK
jgi:hypothetical protein